MATVRKRDGSTEQFNSEKLRSSIEKAAIDAHVELDELQSKIDDTVDHMVQLAHDRTSMKSTEIREEVLSQLETYPEIVVAWGEFDNKYKTSDLGMQMRV